MGKRIKYSNDYLPILQEKFPEFSIEDLKLIIEHGNRMLRNVVAYKGDVLLSSKIDNKIFKLLIGRVNFQSIAHKIRYAIRKMIRKIRFIYNINNIKWDGYYYFGISDEKFNEIWAKKRCNKININFGSIALYRILDECLLNISYKHFFRVKFISELHTAKEFVKDFTTSKAEYILKRSFDGYKLMINDVNLSDLKEF